MVFDTLDIIVEYNKWQCELCGLKFQMESLTETPTEKGKLLLDHLFLKHIKHIETMENVRYESIDDKVKIKKYYSGEKIHVNPLDEARLANL